MQINSLIIASLALMAYIPLLLLWIWALVDCLRREFRGANDKLIWILVILLANWLGALIYLIVGRPRGTVGEDRSGT